MPRPESSAGSGRKVRSRRCTGAAVLPVATGLRRRIGPGSSHSCGKAVAAPGHRLDTASIRLPTIEHPAQRRYLHRQVTVLDDSSWPDGGDDLVLRDDLARLFDQHAQNVERARADRDWLKRAGTIAPEQPAATPVEAEVLESKNRRRSEPLHARSPAAASEPCAAATWGVISTLHAGDISILRRHLSNSG